MDNHTKRPKLQWLHVKCSLILNVNKAQKRTSGCVEDSRCQDTGTAKLTDP